MFDIGWTEILVIAVVAIIVIGPKDLPRMLRSLGRYAGQLRRTAGEFRAQFDDAIRESEFDELRNSLQDASSLNPMKQIRDAVSESMAPLQQSADSIKSAIEASDNTGGEPASASEQTARSPAKAKSKAKSPAKSKAKSKAKPKARARAAKSGG